MFVLLANTGDVAIMFDRSSPGNPDSDSHRSTRRVNFTRVQEVGAATLFPAPDLGIQAVYLVGTEHRWFNAYNFKTIQRADDLFAASARFPDISELFPKGSELLALSLEFIIENCAEPCQVVLEAPDKLSVRNPHFAERIEIFLVRCGLVEIRPGAATAAPPAGSRARAS